VRILEEDLGTNVYGIIAKRISLRHADLEHARDEGVAPGEQGR